MTVVKIKNKGTKIEFENCKHTLEATHLENKINHLGKSQIDVDCLKEIIKNS